MSEPRRPILLAVTTDSITLKELAAAASGFEIRLVRPDALLSACTGGIANVVGVAIEHFNRPRGNTVNAGSDALELLKQVREARPALRRLLISEHCDLTLVVDGLHSGAVHGILYRPIDAHDFCAAMRLTNPATRPQTAPSHHGAIQT